MTDDLHDPSGPLSHRLSRRGFVRIAGSLGAALTVAGFSGAAGPEPSPLFRSAVAIAGAIRDRKLSAVEAVKQALATIDAWNPLLNALVTVCRERALLEATEADRALARGRSMGALHGVPFTVSDAFDTQGVISTAGTTGRMKFVPQRDATVVARLRAAGAILLGKSNTAELSLAGNGHAANLVFGPARNPYDPDQDAKGSSGAGAMVAVGACAFDIGTDCSGAIREPASANGLAGLKPTFGRLPRTGQILGYGGAFDTFVELGPLARSVEDLILLLPILCGPDGSDAAMVPVPLRDPSKVDLRSLRIAHWGSEQDGTVAQAVSILGGRGATIVADDPPKRAEFERLRVQYLAGDGGEYVRRRLERLGSRKWSPDLVPPAASAVSSPEFSRLREELDAIKAEQLAWIDPYDLLVCPAAQPAPAGPPAGIVRMATAGDGSPVTIQLMAKPWREDVLLAAMSLLESSGGWQPPASPERRS